MDIEKVGAEIIDAAIKVHKSLGPGLLESSYQACLSFELVKRNLKVERELAQPIIYDGQRVETGYRVDMLVENLVIIENKVVSTILPIHEAQVLTYLRLSGKWLGYLLNWNTIKMKDGIKRIVYGQKPVGRA